MELAITVIACVITVALGLFVLLRGPKALFAWSFFIMTIFLCVWTTSSYITELHTDDLIQNDITNRLAFVGGYGALLAGVLFTYVFPVKRQVTRRETVLLSAAALVTFGLSATSWVAGEVSFGSDGHLFFSNGVFLPVYIIGFVGFLVLLIRNLVRVPKSLDHNRRSQARLVLIAFALTAGFGLILNVIVPLVTGSWQTTQFSPLVTVILASVIVYAVARHGLFDVRRAVVRTIAYVFSLLTLAGVYYIIAFSISEWLLRDVALVQPIGIALALVLAFIFQPVKQFFDQLTSRLFYKDSYNVDDFFARLNRLLSSSTKLRYLLTRTAQMVGETLKAEQAFFFIYRHHKGRHLLAGTEGHSQLPTEDARRLSEYALAVPGIIVASMLEPTDPLRRLLVSHKLGAVVPLVQDEDVVGFLCLGDHLMSNFTTRDVRVLGALSDELVIAIQNALSVQEVRDLNATLEHRVKEATSELRRSNAQLQRLDEAKDEFISMASHQLRTPLTSIKGYISMLLEEDAGKVSSQQKHLLNEAFLSSERMVRLIGDFLNVSRLETGKFTLEKHVMDLPAVVGQEIESLLQNAKARGISFVYKKPRSFPELELDEAKIRQAIMNFADNAIYYSKDKSKITITLKKEAGYVEFTVKDTGIGVPADEKAELFNKFFRATNARKQRPDGTGVGLFLAKKVIDAHNGKIIFESKEGKGSTFGFRLPYRVTK